MASSLPLRKFRLEPCYSDPPVHLSVDHTGKIGFMCLSSGKREAKTEALEHIKKIIPNHPDLEVPQSTVVVFFAAEHFKMPEDKDATYLDPAVFISGEPELKYAFWDGYMIEVSPLVQLINYTCRGYQFMAGIRVVLPHVNDNDPTDLKFYNQLRPGSIQRLLKDGNDDYKESIKDLRKLPKLLPFTLPPKNGLSHPFSPIALEIAKSPAVKVPLEGPSPNKELVYSAYCPVTYCIQTAYVTKSQMATLLTYDRFGTPDWYSTKCRDCLLQLQRAVRALGHMEPFSTGPDLPDLKLSPPLCALTEIPPQRSFSFHPNQVICKFFGSGGSGQSVLVMGQNRRLEFHNWKINSSFWNREIQLEHLAFLLQNARNRGIHNDIVDFQKAEFRALLYKK